MNARYSASPMSARIAAALFAVAVSSTFLAAVALGLTGETPSTLVSVILA